jgi:hypothetical protein
MQRNSLLFGKAYFFLMYLRLGTKKPAKITIIVNFGREIGSMVRSGVTAKVVAVIENTRIFSRIPNI